MSEIILYAAGVVAALAYVGTWVHALKGTAIPGAGPRVLGRSPQDLICGGVTANP